MEKILTFDCYGTLLNTEPIYQKIGAIARNYGLDQKEAINIFMQYEDRLMYGEDYIAYDQLLLKALQYCDMELNVDIFEKEYQQVFQVHTILEPYPEVVRTLKCLKEKGFQLIVMSNCIHELMNYHLKKLKYVDDVVLAEDTHCYKPQLLFFKYTQEKYYLENYDHCHIAKGYWWDIVPCSRMGWRKIWVNRQGKKGSHQHQPYQEVTTLDKIIDLLEDKNVRMG